MHPLIGVTAGEIINKDEAWSPPTYGQSRTYVDAVIHSGGVPIIIPITDDQTILRELYDKCDGLQVSGGNDPDPALYHAETSPLTIDVSRRRDDQELQLIKWALEDGKPIFGICRGMQLINIHLGGTLYQDIPTELPNATDHRISSKRKSLVDLEHKLRVDPDSRLAAIIHSDTIFANAHHHQAVKELGKGLVATAWSEDGIIEGLELPGEQFVLAVQCHPESLEADAEQRWAEVFSTFIEESKQFSQQ